MANIWLKIRMFFAKTRYACDIGNGKDLTCVIGYKVIGNVIYVTSQTYSEPKNVEE
jgi:hypothetical protein